MTAHLVRHLLPAGQSQRRAVCKLFRRSRDSWHHGKQLFLASCELLHTQRGRRAGRLLTSRLLGGRFSGGRIISGRISSGSISRCCISLLGRITWVHWVCVQVASLDFTRWHGCIMLLKDATCVPQLSQLSVRKPNRVKETYRRGILCPRPTQSRRRRPCRSQCRWPLPDLYPSPRRGRRSDPVRQQRAARQRVDCDMSGALELSRSSM